MDAARAGDVEAFEALVRRYQLPMYRVALRMLASEGDAEDATQEAFILAWQNLARFRGESAYSTWLYRIVTNRCLNARASHPPSEPLEELMLVEGGDPVGRRKATALVRDCRGGAGAAQRAARGTGAARV